MGRKLSKHEGERSVSEKSIESNGMNNGSNRKNGNVRESFTVSGDLSLPVSVLRLAWEIYGCFPQGFRFMAVEHF